MLKLFCRGLLNIVLMSDQVTKNVVKRQQRLKKVVKKHKNKELLTVEAAKNLRDTPLNVQTFQRNARKYYATTRIGTRLVLSHPFTDVHGRYLKSVVLDFAFYKNTGYVHVQPFEPNHDDNHGVVSFEYSYNLNVRSHRELYLKLLKHKLL